MVRDLFSLSLEQINISSYLTGHATPKIVIVRIYVIHGTYATPLLSWNTQHFEQLGGLNFDLCVVTATKLAVV